MDEFYIEKGKHGKRKKITMKFKSPRNHHNLSLTARERHFCTSGT